MTTVFIGGGRRLWVWGNVFVSNFDLASSCLPLVFHEIMSARNSCAWNDD